MKYCCTLILFISCFHQWLFAQTDPLLKQWDFSYGGYDGDFLNQILPTADGGFLAAGNSVSNAMFEKSDDNWDPSMFPTYDIWVIKCDANGVKQWDKSLGGTDDDFFYSVITTADTGFVVIGSTRSPASGNISQSPIGTFDMWIVMLDKNGTINWEKRFGGSGSNAASHGVQLADGGYLIGGYTDSPIGGDVSEPSYGTYDDWILRLDANGNKLWDKRYGGTKEETISKVFLLDDGGFLLAGNSLSNTSGLKTQNLYVNGKSDLWFVRIDSLGNFLWDKQLGSLDDDYALDIMQAPGHHYLVAASTNAGVGADKTEPTHGVADLWMLRTDSGLNVLWDHSIGGTDNEDDFGNVWVTAEGNYMISGTSYSSPNDWKSVANNGPENTWIVLVDSNGNKIWDKTIMTGYTHCELGLGVQLNDGCYLFANDGDGFTQDEKTDMSYSFDYWCIKFCDTSAQSPTILPSFAASQTALCEKFCISYFDSSANNPVAWQWLFQGGDPASSTLQNPGNICYNQPGTYDVTLITTNATGNDTLTLQNYITVYATPALPVITQSGYTLTSTTAFSYQWQLNNVDITGATNQSYVVLQTGLYTVVTSNEQGCVASASAFVTVTGMEEIIGDPYINIYPNPSSGVFHFSLPKNFSGEALMNMYDVMGKEVYRSVERLSSHSSEISVDISSEPEGIYFLMLRSGDTYYYGKLTIDK